MLELLDQGEMEQVFITSKQTVLNEYHIYFDEDVKNPSYYRNALETLGLAGQEDVVVIHINTMGGHLSSTSSLYNALRGCEAVTIGVIEHESSSAGGILAMACDNLIVQPYSVMMMHNAQGGFTGDFSNSKAQLDAFQSSVKDLYQDAFEHFLTNKEIEDILTTGKEIWLSAKEIEERWDNKLEALKIEEELND